MPKKTKQEIDKMHWRDRYEYEAGLESGRLAKMSEADLVRKVESNSPGTYFAVWHILGRKGTVSGAAMPMWRFLQRNPGKHNMLHRYHCAAALFQILGIPDPASENPLRKEVQWDHQGEEARQVALLQLKALIEERLHQEN